MASFDGRDVAVERILGRVSDDAESVAALRWAVSEHHGENARIVVLGDFGLTHITSPTPRAQQPATRAIATSSAHFRQSVPRSGARFALSRGASPEAACNRVLQWYNYLMRAIVLPDEGSYSYAGTGYANRTESDFTDTYWGSLFDYPVPALGQKLLAEIRQDLNKLWRVIR